MSQSQSERPTYTLGQPAARTGLGGLPMTTTIVLFIGMLLFIIFSMVGATKFAFFGVIPLTILSALITYIKRAGRNVADIAQIIIQDLLRNRRGEDVYLSGGFSTIQGGTHRLPGILAATRLVESSDLQGNPIAFIVDENFSEVTFILDAQLSGQAAVTQDERNILTASWGQWLAGLSLPGDIRSASITVETHPSSGELLREEVTRSVSPDAPALAKQIMFEAADQLSAGLPELSAHIAVTIRIPRDQLHDDSFVDPLLSRLSSFIEPLAWAGILARAMSAEEVIARVHSAYNPASEADFELLAVRGHEHGLRWEDAGPLSASTHRSSYHHDGVVSRTWEMIRAPRASFEDRLLTRLLSPHPHLPRKRVTLVYRPFEAGVGARRVEAEHQDALVALNSGRGVASARAEVRLEMTQASRRAQARGAQLGRYSLFVTVTVDDEEKLPAVTNDINQLSATSAIGLRPATRQQDTAFAVALGIGQAPWIRASTMKTFAFDGLNLED